MMISCLIRDLKRFLRTTTLHGFKYLNSPFCLDRLIWLGWCCASACCAGVLCGVLWARFLQAPMLLTRRALATALQVDQRAPLVAICPSPFRAAELVAGHLSLNFTKSKWLSPLFGNILRGKPAADKHRLLLDELLDAHNMSLSQVLMDMSPCKELMRRCRWQNVMVPCNKLFGKELTRWGACCVMRAEKLLNMETATDYFQTTEKLDLMMNCFVNPYKEPYCCEFFVKYRGQDWLGPWYLMSGHSYTTQLIFTSIQDPVKDKLVNGTCVSTPLYSHSRCMILCKETECGCSHPLRLIEDFEKNLPPPCSVMRMKCLGNFIRDGTACNCLPACQRITAYMSMESLVLNTFSYNPIYQNINPNSSIVLNIRIRIRGSKSYDLVPTESWLTLLSSLGGVFNMFLGVGLFSALEFFYALLARLPFSSRRTTHSAQHCHTTRRNPQAS